MPRVDEDIVALDTECTGLDFNHGVRPYLVTICTAAGQQWWEWDVCPLTRCVQMPPGEAAEVRALVESADRLVLQNSKYDVQALYHAGIVTDWPWHKTEDTLTAGHVLASNQPHNLTDMGVHYLGVDILPYEKALQKACQAARRYCRSHLPKWRIAKEGDPLMPSAKQSAKGQDKIWKSDAWLLRRLAGPDGEGIEDHTEWGTLTSNYANADSAITRALWVGARSWHGMEAELRRRGLWEIYRECMAGLPATVAMERAGVTLSKDRTRELKTQYTRSSYRCHEECVRLSGGTLETLPVNGVSNALRETVFGKFRLVSPKTTESGGPSMDKYVLDEWLDTLDPQTDAWQFINNLKKYRKRKTALGYIESYEKFWLGIGPGWAKLYMTLNPTGTDTTRFSCSNPNGQQISKQDIEEDDGAEKHSARYMFGPLPGREWWSIDYSNIEVVLPAYLSGEESMIELFEKPDDPPYFGSYHLLNCSIVYPDLFWPLADKKGAFKEEFKSTWYQHGKNGGFSKQYGGQRRKVDATFHRPGAYDLLNSKLPKMAELNRQCIAKANRLGYVETLPDKTVCPDRGYPLLCVRTSRGEALPTVPLNYVIQGTAGWCARKAKRRCHEYLTRLNQNTGSDYHQILFVHDELVFDFPAGRGKHPWQTNLPIIKKIKALMEQSGDDVGIPLKVSVSYHAENWGEGEGITV